MNLSLTIEGIGLVQIPQKEPTHEELAAKYTNLDEPFGHGGFRRIEGLLGVVVVEKIPMSFATIAVEMTTKAVLGALRAERRRPAFYEELLGYNDYWWEHVRNRERWMRQTIALGSSLLHEKGRGVAGLVHTIYTSFADLRLFQYDFTWPAQTRFLTVRV